MPIERCLYRCALLICLACVFPAVMEAQGQSSAADSAARRDGEWWEGRGAMLSVCMKHGPNVEGELLAVRADRIIVKTDTNAAPCGAPGSPSPAVALAMEDIAIVKGGSGLATIHYILIGCIVGAATGSPFHDIEGRPLTAPPWGLITLALGGAAGALVASLTHNDDPPWYYSPGDDPAPLRQRARYRNGEPPCLRTSIP
jgi:hypothetical protein